MKLIRSKRKINKKLSCPFGRRCLSDSSVCGYTGYYAECPMTIKAEDREDVYGGEEE